MCTRRCFAIGFSNIATALIRRFPAKGSLRLPTMKAQNAAMESFFSSLKTERIRNKVYRTRDKARSDVFDYIERFYNPRRRHSTLGYLSPIEYERRAMEA